MMPMYRWACFAILCMGFRAAAEERYYLDFKDFKPQTARVKFINNSSPKYSKVTDGGLEIEIPAGRDAGPITGFSVPFALGGDFEVTLRYDRFKADTMPTGYGAMVSIWLSIESDPEKGATTTRSRSINGSDRLIANHVSFDEKGKEKYNAFYFPATADAGAVRLARTGSTIRHLAIDGEKGEFKELHSWDFGTEDVVTLRFQLNPGGLDKTASCRFIDFDLKADKFGGPNGRPATKKAAPVVANPVAAVEPESRFPRWMLVVLPFVCFLLGFLVYLLMQGKKDAPER